MNLVDLASSGPLLLAAGVAVAAGAVSFASPCVVPLVPGYLSYLAGVVGADAPAIQADESAKQGRWRVAGAAALFVAGFTAVFAAAVVGFLGLSDAVAVNQAWLARIGGVVTMLMGLVFLGLIPALQREVRTHRVPRAGLWGAPLLGAVFGLGWTPCLGPTLTGVVAVAASTQTGGWTPVRGLLLVLAYCLGLGVPFLLIALGARWAVRATGWLRTHGRSIQITGGVLLLAVGFLLVTGWWGELVAVLRGPIAGFEPAL